MMPVLARATSRLLAVAGDPIAHSLSPVMHNAAISALGLDAVYVAARTTPRAFPGLVFSLLEAGGALNVTAPFKQQAAALVDQPTDAVKRTGACNTIWGEAENSLGDNTDIAGVKGALAELLGGAEPRSVKLYGTGGSARAAAIAVAEAYPDAECWVSSRYAEHETEFVRWAEGGDIACRPAPQGEVADVGINCTPSLDRLPVQHGTGGTGTWRTQSAVLDLNYRPGQTPLVRDLVARDVKAMDGRAMLVHQGVVAFQRFFGVQPPVEIMRAAVQQALGG